MWHCVYLAPSVTATRAAGWVGGSGILNTKVCVQSLKIALYQKDTSPSPINSHVRRKEEWATWCRGLWFVEGVHKGAAPQAA